MPTPILALVEPLLQNTSQRNALIGKAILRFMCLFLVLCVAVFLKLFGMGHPHVVVREIVSSMLHGRVGFQAVVLPCQPRDGKFSRRAWVAQVGSGTAKLDTDLLNTGFIQSPMVLRPSSGEPVHLVLLEADLDTQEKAIDRALDVSVPLEAPAADPYGIVLWPAAVPVAALVVDRIRQDGVLRVIELGAGTGLVSLAAALAGAEEVLATDFNEEALANLNKAADLNLLHEGLRERLVTEFLDVMRPTQRFQDLSAGAQTLLVSADMLYSPSTSRAVARRCYEAAQRGARVLVGDAGRPGAPAFLEELRLAEEENFRRGGGFPLFPLGEDGRPQVAFRPVDAFTLTSPRHGIIAKQYNSTERISVGILEICAGGGKWGRNSHNDSLPVQAK